MREVLVVVAVTLFSSVSILLDLPLLRQISGFLIVLFLPGYAFVKFLFDELELLDKIALGIGMSIAISIFIGLALNFTPFGIRFKPILFLLTATTLIFSSLAAFKILKTRF